MSSQNKQTRSNKEEKLLKEITSLHNTIHFKKNQLNITIQHIEQNCTDMHEQYRNMCTTLHNSWQSKYDKLQKDNDKIKQHLKALISAQTKLTNQETSDQQTEETSQTNKEHIQHVTKSEIPSSDKNSKFNNKKQDEEKSDIVIKKRKKKKKKKSKKQKHEKKENMNDLATTDLLNVYKLFEDKIGKKPSNFMQFFNFIKQETLNHKYAKVKKWWEQEINNNTNNTMQVLTSKTNKSKTKKPPPIKRSRSKRKNCEWLLFNRNRFIKILKNEIKIYKLILSKYNDEIFNENNTKYINKLTSKYALFLNKLVKLKDEKSINNYLESNGKSLHYDVALLWRIHLINPFLYNKHCNTLFGFVLNPKYEYINFSQEIIKSAKRKQKKKALLIKKILNAIDFDNQLKSYLLFMNKILKLYDNEIINKDIIKEYEKYIQFLKQTVFINSDHETYSEKYNDKTNDRILNLSQVVPRLKESFLWYTHILFPNIFLNEIDHKMINQFEIYQYKFMNLNHIIIQNKDKTNEIWEKMKDENIAIEDKHQILTTLYTQHNNELLIYGFVDSIIKDFNDGDVEYVVPVVIVDKIIIFYEDNTYDKSNKSHSDKDGYKRCGVSMVTESNEYRFQMNRINKRRRCF